MQDAYLNAKYRDMSVETIWTVLCWYKWCEEFYEVLYTLYGVQSLGNSSLLSKDDIILIIEKAQILQRSVVHLEAVLSQPSAINDAIGQQDFSGQHKHHG